jgi:hypothetical protein
MTIQQTTTPETAPPRHWLTFIAVPEPMPSAKDYPPRPIPPAHKPATEANPDVRIMTEEELQQDRDWEWCMTQPEILKKYAGQVVVVYREKVWGHGSDHLEALQDAMMTILRTTTPETAPPRRWLTFIAVPEPMPSAKDYPPRPPRF